MKEAAISTNKPVPSPIKKIGSMVCTYMQAFGDLVVIWGTKGEIRAFTKVSLKSGQVKPYQVFGMEVQQVFMPKNHELIILQTEKGIIVRDYQNHVVKDAANWADFFIEPHTHNFYRQNERGNWFNIEGNKLATPVFLLGNVLVSLIGKKSKKSLAFKGVNLLVSPNFRLIQAGKVVFDNQLNAISVFGEKVTGLGKKHIVFGDGTILQEVLTGFKTSTFVNERTLQPFLINDEQITQHVKTVLKNGQRYEVFRTETSEYVLLGATKTCLHCDGEKVKINFNSYVKMGQQELVKCTGKNGSRYMDLRTQSAFALKEVSEETIVFIDLETLNVDGVILRSMATATDRFVFNETDKEIFKLNKGTIQPNAVSEPQYFREYLGVADIKGEQKYFHKKQKAILQLDVAEIEIATILTQKDNHKLLNALSTKGEKIVLDVRKGFDHLERAYANGQAITEVYEYPRNVGRKMLQNAALNTLGGTEKRVIDLNANQLSIFTLPQNLSADPAGISPSLYQGNPLIELDFKHPIKLMGEAFFKGTFLPYHDTPKAVLIQEQSNQPLHLEGNGHKHELVTAFVPSTTIDKYYIGENRMIGAKTLKEDGQEGQILFAFQRKTTWIPFNEAALPVTQNVVKVNTPGDWDYLLFEVKDVDNTLKFMVVEKQAPHRVLVERKKGKEQPRLLNKKAVLPLKLPKEL
ncbi:MAG: hypothetical protein AB8G86_14115, partial [Saprospiraceae bacterium]